MLAVQSRKEHYTFSAGAGYPFQNKSKEQLARLEQEDVVEGISPGTWGLPKNWGVQYLIGDPVVRSVFWALLMESPAWITECAKGQLPCPRVITNSISLQLRRHLGLNPKRGKPPGFCGGDFFSVHASHNASHETLASVRLLGHRETMGLWGFQNPEMVGGRVRSSVCASAVLGIVRF